MLPVSRSNITSTGWSGLPSNHQPVSWASSRVDLKSTDDHLSPVDDGIAVYLSSGETASAREAARADSARTSSSGERALQGQSEPWPQFLAHQRQRDRPAGEEGCMEVVQWKREPSRCWASVRSSRIWILPTR